MRNVLIFILTVFAIILSIGSVSGAYYDVTEFSVIRDNGNNYKWVNDTPCAVTCYMQYHANRYDRYPGCWESVTFRVNSPSASSTSTVFDPSCGADVQPYMYKTFDINKHGYTTVGFNRDPTNCALCPGASTSRSSTLIFHARDVPEYTVSGTTECITETELYIQDGAGWVFLNIVYSSTYTFKIVDGYTYRLLFDGAYYEFTCSGADVVFDYGACLYVYGYTCGVDTIILRDSNFQLVGTVAQNSSYDIYEMGIMDGEEYTISFYDIGILLCYEQTFTCTGDHVSIDFDRCNWVYPPNGAPYIIYLWSGYDYNIVVFKDEHGNFIENSQLAIYDKTDNKYLQRWTDASDGYTLLGARFDTDHDVLLSLRTFDGIFTLDTTYPANGSAAAGEEDITTTNWTIPIKYNLDILPVDQYGMAMFDVFCGLSEYTPINPGAFWGMDLSDRGYVPVTNCSGFAMCDIIAEKEGYEDYNVTALNWTSKSAMVKDYRHNIVMEKE